MRIVARRVYVCGGAAAAASVRRLSTTAMTLPPSAEAAAHERSISSAAAASRSSSIVCTSLAQAHVRLSMLLLQQQEQQQRQHSTVSPPSSSLSLSSSSRALSTAAALMRVRAWWHAAQSRVLVPRDVYAIEDMPLLLLEVVRGRQLHHVLAEQQRRSVLAAHAWAKAAATTTTAAAAAAAVTAHEGGLERFVHMSEEAILREFDEWVCMHSPLYTQPSNSNNNSSGNTPVTSVVPYTTMMRFVASYVRYHRGVRWGSAAAAAATATAASSSSSSLHKSPSGNYVLHPFHDLYCPHSHVAQMPYVHVLQWMRDRRGSTNKNNKDNNKDSARDVDDAHTESADEQVRLWQQHRARRACALPHGFAALDVCCQSGYAVDLLLKAGAAHITAVDTTPLPLANTEATAREHVRDKRSRAAYERRVQVQQCELLPLADATTTQTTVGMQHDNASPATRQRSSSSSDSSTSNAFADAAARRRQRARQLGRCGAVDTLPDVSDAEGTADAALSSLRQQEQEQHAPRSYDVLYVHPPPPMLLPVTTLTTAASLLQQQQQRRRSTWWQLVHTVAAEEGEQERTARSSSSLAQQHILLPYTVCAADAPPHPHSSMHALQQLVQSLRDDVTRRCPHDVSQHQSQSQPQQPSSLLPCALLRDDGYVVMVLPRTFDVDELMQMLSHTTTTTPLSSYALSDFVVTQLDGLYDVVLRRRHCANELAVAAVVDNNSSSDDAALWRFLLAQVQPVAQQQHMRRAASEAAWREVCTFAQTHMWTDVLVLQKRADVARAHRTRLWRSSTGGSSVDAAAQQLLQQPPLHNNNNNTTHDDDNDDDDDSNPVSREGVRWQDSFEYNEYKPRSAGAPTTHHWSDRVPSYSYLEADYWSPAEREAASRNYLAVGHTPQLQRTTTTTTQSTTTTTTTPVTKDGTVRAVAEAAARFRGIFDAELRRRRRTRIRKAALGTHAQQEWLIDAKLARSQAAKVEFMNEVSRYNLKEPTD